MTYARSTGKIYVCDSRIIKQFRVHYNINLRNEDTKLQILVLTQLSGADCGQVSLLVSRRLGSGTEGCIDRTRARVISHIVQLQYIN